MELLFESRKTILKTGKIYPIQHKPLLEKEPAIVADNYTDASGATVNSVIKDGGRYRMWYTSWPEDYNGSDDMALGGYAESDNCIDWKKPNLGLIEYAGNKSNNLCNPGGVVFMDPESTDCRYRSCGYWRPKRASFSDELKGDGYYTFHSSDGFIWKPDSPYPRWPGGDAITVIYHPVQKRGIIAMKYFLRVSDIHRRTIFLSDFKKGIWSEPLCALVPDEYADICARRDGYSSSDYYGMGMMPAGKGTVGFLWQFRHTMPLETLEKYALTNFASDGVVDISLVYQENPGDRWLHQPGRRNFISHNEDGVSRAVYSAASPVEVGDEQWLFYTGTHLEHVAGYGLETHKKYGLGSIRVAKWKKNRLFGFNSMPEGTLEIYLGSISRAFKLKLNARTEREGYIRVSVYGSMYKHGYWVKDPNSLIGETFITGDLIDETIFWNGKEYLQPMLNCSTLILKIDLKLASVYAYDIVPEKNETSA